jgi:hypothetical protein
MSIWHSIKDAVLSIYDPSSGCWRIGPALIGGVLHGLDPT